MYVGSETSRVEVTVYHNHPSEFPVVQNSLTFTSIPVNEEDTTTMHVVSVQTSKRLGEPAGRFEVQIKGPIDLRKSIQDGDWIDIVFTRHNSRYHVMRGIVQTIAQNVNATSGPTVATYSLVGEDFGSIFSVQRFWFDQLTQGQYLPWVADRITQSGDALRNGTPDFVVGSLLHGLILPGNNRGAGLWELPKGMPVQVLTGEPREHVPFHTAYQFISGYSNVPPRTSLIIPERFSASGETAWAVANEFSDGELCEFFTDLVAQLPPSKTAQTPAVPGITGANSVYITGESTPETTVMAVIFRDQPFPNSVRDADNMLEAPYFSLPLVSVTPQEVEATELAVHGELRKNTFFFGPSLLQDQVGPYHELQLPLVDLESIKHHGTRRHDAESRYFTDTEVDQSKGEDSGKPDAGSEPQTSAEASATFGPMAYSFRDIVRDLHCMDHMLFNGTISLNRSEPMIRIGTRFRILGESRDKDFTAYVEEVSHSWNFVRGSRTSLTVTHGWEGTDQAYVDKLRERISKFAELEVVDDASPPEETDVGSDFLSGWQGNILFNINAKAEKGASEFRDKPTFEPSPKDPKRPNPTDGNQGSRSGGKGQPPPDYRRHIGKLGG